MVQQGFAASCNVTYAFGTSLTTARPAGRARTPLPTIAFIKLKEAAATLWGLSSSRISNEAVSSRRGFLDCENGNRVDARPGADGANFGADTAKVKPSLPLGF